MNIKDYFYYLQGILDDAANKQVTSAVTTHMKGLLDRIEEISDPLEKL